MSVILRVDDFPYVKDEEKWKHNLDNFKKFDAVLEKHGIQEYVLGVIPTHTNSEMIKWLAENPRIEVALHGIQHSENFPNEFRTWETEDDILKKIVSACQVLQECNGDGKITTYIPPHNVIDLKTARALSRAGFEKVLGGPGSDVSLLEDLTTTGIIDCYYSEHPIWYGRSDEMLSRDFAHEKILSSKGDGFQRYLTFHWTWEQNIGLHHLDRFLTQIKEAL